MTQEKNQPANQRENDSRPDDTAAAGAAPEPGAARTPARRGSRRSTAAPATLRRAAELVQSAPSGPSHPADRGNVDSGAGSASEHSATGSRNTEPGTGRGPRAGKGVLPLLSGEDDPRAWGDRPEDTADWLREQRPPHWG